ncbi:MAG TPA: hypothetical protein VEK33_19630 [Terriglobales bacterium]|nr:hypothetical protein [Terriglobales bacterium]
MELLKLVNQMPNRFFGALLKRSAPAASADSVRARRMAGTASARWDVIDNVAREAGLDTFPNDLTRLLYLASLRDCNSGAYLHPQLSARMGTEVADHALCACHDRVFRRLLITPISGYVVQLEEYIRYARADRSTVLNTWQSLRAYRATVPVLALPVYCEIFWLNIELALTVLQAKRPPADAKPQDAASRWN